MLSHFEYHFQRYFCKNPIIWSMSAHRQNPEMREGPEAFNRFQIAVKAILKVSKSDLPPSPFDKPKRKRKSRPKS